MTWEWRGFQLAEWEWGAQLPPEPREPSEEEEEEQAFIDHLLERGEQQADMEWDEQ